MPKPGAISASDHLLGQLPWGAAGNASPLEMGHDGRAVDLELARERVHRRAALMLGDEVVDLGVGEASLDGV